MRYMTFCGEVTTLVPKENDSFISNEAGERNYRRLHGQDQRPLDNQNQRPLAVKLHTGLARHSAPTIITDKIFPKAWKEERASLKYIW